MTDQNNLLDTLDELLTKAKALGADSADAVFVRDTSLSVTRRLGETEHLERSEGADLGLRVFVGKQQAIVSSSDTTPDALDQLTERAIAMARSVPEDTYCGLAEPNQLSKAVLELESCDDTEPSAESLVELATKAEDAALAVPGVTNSEGGEAGWGRTNIAVAATNGFARAYSRSGHNISASVLAGEGTAMERDYDYDSTVFGEDLRDAAEIGKSAGEKAVKRLNPQTAETAQVPVILDPRVSHSIIGHLSGAINGSSVARGTTFLKDKMRQLIFPKNINIVDDPHRHRGLKSKPFDGEGLPTTEQNIVENGVLQSWILDLRSARQLGLESTGHASRGTSSPPSPSATNLYLEAGILSPAELMKDIKSGFYITEMIGFGINGLTGDYSRGATGFWIENGEITYPVSEMTVAGNLNDMFMNLTAADDLVFRYGTDAPTLRIDGMTVAGI